MNEARMVEPAVLAPVHRSQRRCQVMGAGFGGQRGSAVLTSVSDDRRPSSAVVLKPSRRYLARQSASSSRFANANHACGSGMNGAAWICCAVKRASNAVS